MSDFYRRDGSIRAWEKVVVICRISMLVGLYLLLGCVVAALAYLVTGVPWLESDFPVHTDKLARIPILMIGFILFRFPVAVLEAIVLSWVIKLTNRRGILFAVAISLPLAIELIVLDSVVLIWADQLWKAIISWPAIPEYIIGPGQILRIAASYLGLPIMTGLGLATIMVHLEERRHRANREGGTAPQG